MTVSSTTSRKSFAGDGATTAFATSPMVFFVAADLKVYVVSGGTATLKTITTHYTVSGGDGSTGTVTMITAPAVGETLLLVRELAVTQGSDFVNNDSSDAEVVEDALDRLTMISQELDTRIDRAFTLPTGDVSGASTELPAPAASKLIGWNSAGLALQNYAASDFDTALLSAYGATLIDDANKEAARVTLGFPAVAAKGDLFAGSAADTIVKLAAGTDGYTLQAQSGATAGLQYLPPQAGFSLQNGYLDWSVSGNVLTVAIKTFAGTDPSSTDPVYVSFRSATVGTGSLVVRKLTAATTVTVSDTATLGTANSTAFRLWAVAFDDGGTVRLGVINALSGTNIYPLAGWGIASSTAEGTGSDSAHVFYSDTAVTSKAYATLGFASWETGLATAGTWSAAPTRAQLFGHGVPLPGQIVQTQRTATGAVATGTTILPIDDTIPQNTEGDQYMSQAITPSSSANILTVKHGGLYAANGVVTLGVALFQDAIANALAAMSWTVPASGYTNVVTLNHILLAGMTAATTFKVRAGLSAASTLTFNGGGGTRQFGGVANSYLAIEEIMA